MPNNIFYLFMAIKMTGSIKMEFDINLRKVIITIYYDKINRIVISKYI